MLMLLEGLACVGISTYLFVFISKMPGSDDIDY